MPYAFPFPLTHPLAPPRKAKSAWSAGSKLPPEAGSGPGSGASALAPGRRPWRVRGFPPAFAWQADMGMAQVSVLGDRV
jgi:hypothetical protein